MGVTPGGGGYRPAAWRRSARLTAVAAMARRTCDGDADGGGTRASRSAPPAVATTARMRVGVGAMAG